MIKEGCVGSKSEGRYVYLQTNEQEYHLFREGIHPAGDDFFLPFDGMIADVNGEEENTWIAAKSITVWCDESNNLQEQTTIIKAEEQKNGEKM